MRKILFAFAIMMAFGMFVPVQAQDLNETCPNYGYRSDYKYSFFSNWSIGFAFDETKTTDFNDWTVGDGIDFGAQLRATKRIGNRWNLRYIADLPGTYRYITGSQVNTFDDYAKLTSGVSLNFLKFAYLFADAGIAFDADGGPSFSDNINSLSTGKGITPVGQAGIGINIDFGKKKYDRIFVEIGADCRPHYNQNIVTPAPFEWIANTFAYLGYTRNLGITAKDRCGIDMLERCPEEVARLTEENTYLRNENSKCGSANADLAQALSKSTEMNDRLEKELAECQARKCDEPQPVQMQVYFEYGSCKLSDLEIDRLKLFAEQIKTDGGKYAIDGYASIPGSEAVNQTLSERRAKAVYDQLVKLGVGEYVDVFTGHGKTDQFGAESLNQMVTITRK